MATGTRATREKLALLAALRRFPKHAQAIERLMYRSEAFHDMCEELAEAELALSMIDAVPISIREARMLECKSWIERLRKEIDQALQSANVIPIARPNEPRDR